MTAADTRGGRGSAGRRRKPLREAVRISRRVRCAPTCSLSVSPCFGPESVGRTRYRLKHAASRSALWAGHDKRPAIALIRRQPAHFHSLGDFWQRSGPIARKQSPTLNNRQMWAAWFSWWAEQMRELVAPLTRRASRKSAGRACAELRSGSARPLARRSPAKQQAHPYRDAAGGCHGHCLAGGICVAPSRRTSRCRNRPTVSGAANHVAVGRRCEPGSIAAL